MFEKSLYDLIRGLRNHKGNEREYIQNSLRECRAEIRGADMDLKATALLKIIYLEMFGHDMSWASFNVLEVMSSPKYLQKRVGYLGAVQSFRPDTEILMLATNLLKKDINASSIPTISLPLVTLPHIITPSLALSLLPDLLPRLSHSNPSVRKKTIVALYRLALAHPETLRPTWPKIKDMLMSEDEDPSVTAAAINVVCELGWRRPKDFLPLAPRLFELLVNGGNNWMAIKIIKLFATLTPLEPRLIKKLLPPLMDLIRQTPAMSLLYECINGIIQGGILEGTEGAHEGDEVAALCVGKLRGMIASESDPNLKYVALLAFNKIVLSHPHIVAQHQDAIMGCIDHPDLSIRFQALELGSGMISTENLVPVVNRLLKQLREAALREIQQPDGLDTQKSKEIEPVSDSDREEQDERTQLPGRYASDDIPVSDDYRISTIRQILGMCCRNTYANITDFNWYIEVLVELVRVIPLSRSKTSLSVNAISSIARAGQGPRDISEAVGAELRNIAVRVKAVRERVVRASEAFVIAESQKDFTALGIGGQGVLQFAAWIAGEYAEQLAGPRAALESLLTPTIQFLNYETVCAYLQAIPKILIVATASSYWDPQQQSQVSLLLTRIIRFLEPLITHPNLEVQERAVEIIELVRLTAEAVRDHIPGQDSGPLLLTKAMPSLFGGLELNPVASGAQHKIPKPTNIDLMLPLNSKLSTLLQSIGRDVVTDDETAETERSYYQRPLKNVEYGALADVAKPSDDFSSYQYDEYALLTPANKAKKRAERQDKNRDDPFYIPNTEDWSSRTGTPFHDIFVESNGQEFDINSIPIMDLDTGDARAYQASMLEEKATKVRQRPQEIQVTMEENFVTDEQALEEGMPLLTHASGGSNKKKSRKSLLVVDSSGLGNLETVEDQAPGGSSDDLRPHSADEEMAKALEEVERLRLQMQRASEKAQVANDVPVDGTLVKKRKVKKKTAKSMGRGTAGEGSVGGGEISTDTLEKKKKKKKKSDDKKNAKAKTQVD